MERVLIICNESWEMEAVLTAVFNGDFPPRRTDQYNSRSVFRIKDLDFPRQHLQGEGKPCLIFETNRYQFEFWCIQHIMDVNPGRADNYFYSRSIQKAVNFPAILNFEKEKGIQLVIAFGTAGSPGDTLESPGLVIGSDVYIHDASPELPSDRKYYRPDFGKIIPSALPESFFDKLNREVSTNRMKLYFESKTLMASVEPSLRFSLLADKHLVAISDVNIKFCKNDKTTHKAALDSYSAIHEGAAAFSVEATHGLVRLEAQQPNFLFISAITNGEPYGDHESLARKSYRHFSSCFNGGIFLSWLVHFINGN
ncbi:hypothetical protein ACX0G9_26245 [Flavitalea flava]